MLAIVVTAAFVCGFFVSRFGLPPLVGFLLAGFLLRGLGMEAPDQLEYIGNFGVSLLLFTIGIKLKVSDLARPIVWAGGTLHLLGTTVLLGMLVYLLGGLGLPIVSGITLPLALLVGFALSFSSTVFAVKSLEERAELAAMQGVIAVGILIMQDILAVGFLAGAAGKLPSVWSFLLLLMVPASSVLIWMLKKCGHGELLILLGFALTYAAYSVFEYFGVKGDLGAIAMGMLMGRHPMAKDMAKTLLGFKDVFLMAFFVYIGLSEELTTSAVVLGAVLLLILPVKVVLYYLMLTRFHLKPRASFLASVVLANYSEFGLVVMAVAVNYNGWLPGDWLVVLAIALSLSFLASAPLNTHSHTLYDRYCKKLEIFDTVKNLPEQATISLAGVKVIIFGMGRVGTGAYHVFEERYGPDSVLGVDSNPDRVQKQKKSGMHVIEGDATDPDFWERVDAAEDVRLILLAMANHQANIHVAEVLRQEEHPAFIAATARFADQEQELLELGIDHVYNFYAGAGAGFADRAWKEFDRSRFDRHEDVPQRAVTGGDGI
ncbi:MAG: cation:proton antiporter family protein [Verrucomicrobiota bacterium]